MIAAFTPAPWLAGEGGGLGATTFVYETGEDGKQRSAIAGCTLNYVERPFAEREANARLIATAPDYDDFTSDALPQLEVLHSTLPAGEARVAVWRVILKGRAALAKARGEP